MPGKGVLLLVLIAVPLILVDFASGQAPTPVNRCHQLLDFEDKTQQKCFVTPESKGKITYSTSKAKHGATSLKWESDPTGTSRLRYNRPSSAPITGGKLKRGGIKMWLYKERATTGKKMEVRFRDTSRGVRVGSFKVDLGFKGWRGIWVAYKECKKNSNSLDSPAQITRIDFALKHHDTIYIDLVDLVESMSQQSRDKIVPPFKKFGIRYDTKKFWQQTYRWSQQTPTALPVTVDPSKSLSLAHIESRLKNWYCDETQTTYDFMGAVKKRWDVLKESFEDAHKEYDRLIFTTKPGSSKIVISGPPLFCRGCDKGTRKYSTKDPTRKFSFVVMHIMLPLALEFYLKSRPGEIANTITIETPRLSSTNPEEVMKSVQKICGKRANRKDEFQDYLNRLGTPYTADKVRKALHYINKVRLQRIINLLDYIEDQGWADGSAIGSLDHEMNRDGAGYMHTLFLLKDSFHENAGNKTRLLNLIKTAKWYNDFGEVYQSTFEFSGTTADRMITILLFRLMIVLMMPTSSEDELNKRQRDMDALKRWMDNALAINEAFGGVIKPDFTGFHHQTFYASAYSPHALHTAAQVQYLLEGTHFALSDTSKRNLREALKTMRLISVKYSSPSSVGGRLPDFSKKILIRILPAYAYISVSHPDFPSQPLPSTPSKGLTVPDTNGASMFLRLYQPLDADVKTYLEDGEVRRGKSYMNSLGSLQIMSTVNSRATSAEPAPEGHWSKNFAALSIHRRKDWAVTVKGFNRFIWDFEGSTKIHKPENVFGTYQSHGSMLIANSEEALKAHDINNGWDWTKVPGATTMSLTLEQTRLRKARNFSPLSSAGGVTYQGPEPLSSGVFGMDFHQPDYSFFEVGHPHPRIKLHFKKSVFFYQNVLVCLGSNITIDNGGSTKALTTLFQDKLVSGTSSIEVDDVRKDSSSPFKAMKPLSSSGKKGYTTLVDTKGNSYYIPRSTASNLKVHVQTQNSKTSSGRASRGTYATAWLEHRAPNGKYEYAIYVKTPSYEKSADFYWGLQQHNQPIKLYRVLKQDDEAHVVQFEMTPERFGAIPPLYGYVIFRDTTSLPSGGLVAAVDKQCRIMAEENGREVFLSISFPDLNFPGSKRLKTSGDITARDLYDIESREIQVEVILTRHVSTTLPVPPKVHGSPAGYVPSVRVEKSPSSPPNKGNKLVFINLKNGFSVEVKLSK